MGFATSLFVLEVVSSGAVTLAALGVVLDDGGFLALIAILPLSDLLAVAGEPIERITAVPVCATLIDEVWGRIGAAGPFSNT